MNDKKKNKKYVKPEVEIVDFTDEDIITTSSPWGDDGVDNREPW